MTTEHHLGLIDGMRTQDFPSERLHSGTGVSAPGYHTALLLREDLYGEDDTSGRAQRRAQCLAEHDALLTLLTLRWGEPQLVSLWSAQERMMAGEAIADPWAEPVSGCEYLQLWRVDGRWIAMVLYLQEAGVGCELGVIVTVVDPP
ncbi:hypothetical protein OG206_28105 [Streptomyces sp. NBC_01341]|uniref:hypothetical protein n=1 Tax=Streptomyces sp. NBC_01341 TaxID=2903831 RepID=UPI002E0F7A81|nr:hypothetical protein OG206_28105 [Streptomyces sp. NBC_01341]